MTEEMHEEHRMYQLAKNRFVGLIMGSIVVALVLVVIALYLYSRSGAAQVDLSRPGYSSVRGEVKEDDDSTRFPGTGSIDKDSLALFERLYSKTAGEATKSEVFHSDIISDGTLRITGEESTVDAY